MKVALLGRSRLALRAGEAVLDAGHQLALIATAAPADYYDVGVDDFAGLAQRAAAPLVVGPEVTADVVAQLEALDLDAGVSVNWPRIIGAAPIRAFRHGILNAHAGDLPRYRGNACPNWAILNGEAHVGLCVHAMLPDELDTGPVLRRDRFPLGPDTYIGEVVAWLEQRIPELFVSTLDHLAAGPLTAESAGDPALGLRCYPRRPEDSRIDWRQPAAAVRRLIRASSRPFGGAFSMIEGTRRVTIWRADVYEHVGGFLAVPGQVLVRVDGDPVIACGEGALRLTDISVDGEADGERARRAVAGSLRRRLVS